MGRALLRALEEKDYLVFALVGRSLIEQFAVLVYYGREKVAPLLRERRISELPVEEATALAAVLNRFIAGHRHSWEGFFAGVPAAWRQAAPPEPQVNILTCLQKWDRISPGVGAAYSMFCDMVHPNLGSVLLHARVEAGELVIGGRDSDGCGSQIVEHALPRLVRLLQEVPVLLDHLMDTAGEPDATAGSR